MQHPESSAEIRRRARGGWPVARRPMGQEASGPGPDPAAGLAMMWQLALDAWSLTARPLPDYARGAMPVVRLRVGPGDPHRA